MKTWIALAGFLAITMLVDAADKRGVGTPMSNPKDLAKIEMLQKKNAELELQNFKLRQRVEAQAEEHRQISRSLSAQQAREVRILAESNAVLRAIVLERKGAK